MTQFSEHPSSASKMLPECQVLFDSFSSHFGDLKIEIMGLRGSIRKTTFSVVVLGVGILASLWGWSWSFAEKWGGVAQQVKINTERLNKVEGSIEHLSQPKS